MKKFQRTLLLSAGLLAALSGLAQANPPQYPLPPISFEEGGNAPVVELVSVGEVPMILASIDPYVVPPAIPEPATTTMLVAGLLLVGVAARRRWLR